MNEKHFIHIERATVILAALLLGLGWIFFSREALFATSVGAGLVVLNTLLLRRISRRALRLPPERRVGAILLLFNVKLGIMVGLIIVALRFLHLSPIHFIVGISVFPLAIIAVAVRNVLVPDDAVDSGANGDVKHG